MKVLIVVDMQNDFLTGALKNYNACQIVPKVVDKINKFEGIVIATRDTHFEDNYARTIEGKIIDKHCIEGSYGWQLEDSIEEAIRQKPKAYKVNKYSFAYDKWEQLFYDIMQIDELEEIELVGVCTDLCVLNNAIILQNLFPTIKVSVDKSCCAGTTVDKHNEAIKIMMDNLIGIKCRWTNYGDN